MKNTFGSALSVTLFGESHGPAVGAVLDGLAPGIQVDGAFVAAELDKRRAAGEISTARREADVAEFLSGIYEGRTTGTPLCIIIRNADTRGGDYAAMRDLPRPGHADYSGHKKYFGYADARGGGHFSGRLTAPLVAAGAICRTILSAHGVTVGTHMLQCAGIEDIPLPGQPEQLERALAGLNGKAFAVCCGEAEKKMREAILEAKRDGDSVGGILETAVAGLPPGLGEPFFGSVESVISALLFSIPAVKGVQFGLGFEFAPLRGSQAGEEFIRRNNAVQTATNMNGGVNGGISNGMPLLFRTAVKPTATIAKERPTINLATGEPAVLKAAGRHDPCIIHRARAVVDAVCAIGLVDLFSQRFGTLWQNPGLGQWQQDWGQHL